LVFFYVFTGIVTLNKKLSNLKKSFGKIMIISAPSGAGKTTICDSVIKSCKNIVSSVSYTTRTPRIGEQNGREYFFVSKTEFKKMINDGKFIEWAIVHNNYYGTPKDLLDKVLTSGKDILLKIDVQGGMNMKKQYPQACMIFIMTPNIKILEKRLRVRNKDCKKAINIRLNNAIQELKYLKKYDYLVINKKLDDAINGVKTIIKSLEYKINK
jgi:guanylate kinase